MHVPFNRPYMSGRELEYIQAAIASGKISGDGLFTKKCHQFFEQQYGFHKALLTTSCTDALEMCALLIDCQPGDEVIMPSYTFVSTANAFVLRGAKIVFADSQAQHPNLAAEGLRALITPKTKAIVVVHYGGVACDMEAILALAHEHGLFVIEDAAQAIDAYYTDRPLGSLGHLAAFSFHETKNIIAGEGGMLAINDPQFAHRAEIIREKGTNRSAFFRGEVDKYGWTDLGSSFLPSELTAAFLFAQIENLERIQARRQQVWQGYHAGLQPLAELGVGLPQLPGYATNNAHVYYLVCRNAEEQQSLLAYCKDNGINAVFHYLSLHQSRYFQGQHDGRALPNSDRFSECLVRLPLFYEITEAQQAHVVSHLRAFYGV
jgi:dTDP-4-amino-4,6-dideoxygalactose transaminase